MATDPPMTQSLPERIDSTPTWAKPRGVEKCKQCGHHWLEHGTFEVNKDEPHLEGKDGCRGCEPFNEHPFVHREKYVKCADCGHSEGTHNNRGLYRERRKDVGLLGGRYPCQLCDCREWKNPPPGETK